MERRGTQMVKMIDITGQRFGKLTVLKRDTVNTPEGRARWICQCDCGTIKSIPGKDLRSGNTQSCGCLVAEHIANVGRNHTHLANYKDGRSKTPEYHIWSDMKRRCNNINRQGFKNYGGRGIKVCDRWTDFTNFLEDMGPRPSPNHSLERINNEGNYEPGNVKWAVWEEQAINTRRNTHITFNGRTQTLAEWAREIGISPAGLCTRLYRAQMSVEDALTTPIRQS